MFLEPAFQPLFRVFVKHHAAAIGDRGADFRKSLADQFVQGLHAAKMGIQVIAQKLQRLIPEARIAVGHGQMPEDQLERAMMAFSSGEYDVLVSTTIIENGLDIPNANTIIVNNAAHFGLAQLYQLRGRVGRAAHQAYAYFFYNKDAKLTPVQEKRLRAIFEATELGAGFRIAMKDLEIRGAGNLLGAEQSGFMNSVGFDLYSIGMML